MDGGCKIVDATCTVCHENIVYFAVGHCDHPICYKCSTQMRVLCNQNYCAICRADLPKVAFIRGFKKFDQIRLESFCILREHGLFFEDERIKSDYHELLENRCKICRGNPRIFASFKELQTHLNREHGLFYCDLCLDNLKLFSCDRKFYDRKQLAEHKRHGDPNDTSYRLHPLCKFCDKRYFDNDDLMMHLRKDHFFCHFCEKTGITNEFFEEYKYLKDHFREAHFLCEEDGCAQVEFVNAFQSEIDLKAHRSSMHSKHLGKQQARQLRAIDIDVNYEPRPNASGRQHDNRRRGGAAGGGFEDRNRGGERNRFSEKRAREQQEKRSQVDAALALSMSLADAQRQGSISVIDQQLVQNSRCSVQRSQTPNTDRPEFNVQSDDFPSLRGQVPSNAKIPKTSDEQREAHKERPGSLAQVLAHNTGRSTGRLDDVDFPMLGKSKQDPGRHQGSIWNGNVARKESASLLGKTQNKGFANSATAENWKSGMVALENSAYGLHKSKTAPSSLTDFPVLGKLSNGVQQDGGTWLRKKETAEPNHTQEKERDGLLKLEIKSKGKQRRDNQQVINAKQSKIEASVTSDKENGGLNSGVEKAGSLLEHQATSLADIARRICGDYDSSSQGNGASVSTVSSDAGKKNETGLMSGEEKKQGNKGKGKSKGGAYGPDPKETVQKSKDTSTSKTSEVKTVSQKMKETNQNVKEMVQKKDTSTTKTSEVKTVSHRTKGTSENKKDASESKIESQKKKAVLQSKKESIDLQQNDRLKMKSSEGVYAEEFKMPSSSQSKNDSVGDVTAAVASFSVGSESDADSDKASGSAVDISIADGDSISSGVVKSLSTETSFSLSDFPNLVSNSSQPVVQPAVNWSGFTLKDFPSLGKPVAPCAVKEVTFGSCDSTFLKTDSSSGFNSLSDLYGDTKLGVTSVSLALPPPGFQTGAAKPPPGFASKAATSKPPPGFSKPTSSEMDSEPTVNISSHQMQSSTLHASTYLPPKHSQERYARLINNITKENSTETFQTFKTLSMDFRQDKISGKDYYNQCSEVMGLAAFRKIFPELIVLLPNISKQQELLSAHRNSHHAQESFGKEKPHPWDISRDGLICCSFCGQVILCEDDLDHSVAHGRQFDA